MGAVRSSAGVASSTEVVNVQLLPKSKSSLLTSAAAAYLHGDKTPECVAEWPRAAL